MIRLQLYDDSGQYRESERGWVYSTLMAIGGFYGAFTYSIRGGVFCNAQTANFVLFAMAVGDAHWSKALYYLIPMTAYFLGAFLTELAFTSPRWKFPIHWETALIAIEMGIVVVLLNVIHWPAWAALFIGCVVLAIMFWKRYQGFHKIVNTLAEGAKNSQSVIQTAAICGLASVVGSVPGYNLLLSLLEKASFGSPYIMLFVCIAVIAGFTGSATGGLAFVLDNFTDKLVAMGGNPETLTRIANISQITFDSLPHNSAIVLTLSYCGVTHKEGYKHLFVVTVVTTTLATIANIIMAHLGVI